MLWCLQSSQNQGRAVTVPWKEAALILMDAPTSLVLLKTRGALGDRRQAKADWYEGTVLILTLLPAQKWGQWGETVL